MAQQDVASIEGEHRASPFGDALIFGAPLLVLALGHMLSNMLRTLPAIAADVISADIAVQYGDTPVGPWTAPTTIWTAPEDTLTPNTYVYNAKAHPHLSKPGELLISYNVNTFSFGEHFENSDIYRPRFIKLPL